MLNKNTFLEQALTLFTQYGCKRVSMNDIAHALGVSKKTLYIHFKHKDELFLECVSLLLRRSHTKMSRLFYHAKPLVDPIKSIIHIYRIALKELRNLSPTFIYSLKKYYQDAYKLYEDFRQKIVWTYILNLLEQAKNRGQVRENINLKLICELFLLRIDDIILPHSDFFNSYTTEELLEHLIIVPLQGIKR
ncbi:TetR/AcrR family transcriptional regulator [Pseudozobellia sp. WGM2]|uniref:TetR/AcrR family transcriptional regulator n=1 Tax=Pseudozobellia sp. WGM2 TaxID=2787625 RepID=UPI001ADEC35E|nr:TetR/AcrR family transcriptional regulator [Pseudozobellia sp. WGM2]